MENWKRRRRAESPGGLLELDTVQPGIGVQIYPSANITINGAGIPDTGELKVALNFENNTDTHKRPEGWATKHNYKRRS